MEIENGTLVKMMSGDRDRVGEYSYVEKIDPVTGNCEFHGSCDYCYGNVNEIGTPEQFAEPEWYRKYPRLSYVLVDPQSVSLPYLRRRFK